MVVHNDREAAPVVKRIKLTNSTATSGRIIKPAEFSF